MALQRGHPALKPTLAIIQVNMSSVGHGGLGLLLCLAVVSWAGY